MTRQAKITNIIQQVGIPPNIFGYYYVRDAVMMVLDDIEILLHITKSLYPMIAKKHNSTPTKVQRAIRHAVAIAWDRGYADFIMNAFGHADNQKIARPSNSEFIGMIADKIRLDEINC